MATRPRAPLPHNTPQQSERHRRVQSPPVLCTPAPQPTSPPAVTPRSAGSSIGAQSQELGEISGLPHRQGTNRAAGGEAGTSWGGRAGPPSSLPAPPAPGCLPSPTGSHEPLGQQLPVHSGVARATPAGLSPRKGTLVPRAGLGVPGSHRGGGRTGGTGAGSGSTCLCGFSRVSWKS